MRACEEGQAEIQNGECLPASRSSSIALASPVPRSRSCIVEQAALSGRLCEQEGAPEMREKNFGVDISSQEGARASSQWFRGDRSGTAPMTPKFCSTLSRIAQTPDHAIKECMIQF